MQRDALRASNNKSARYFAPRVFQSLVRLTAAVRRRGCPFSPLRRINSTGVGFFNYRLSLSCRPRRATLICRRRRGVGRPDHRANRRGVPQRRDDGKREKRGSSISALVRLKTTSYVPSPEFLRGLRARRVSSRKYEQLLPRGSLFIATTLDLFERA